MFYLDLFRCLHEQRVRYLLVGGLAMNLHGVPRMTMDVDLTSPWMMLISTHSWPARARSASSRTQDAADIEHLPAFEGWAAMADPESKPEGGFGYWVSDEQLRAYKALSLIERLR